MRDRPEVTVAIVSHNSAEDLPACLDCLARLEWPRLRVVVVDCASSDRSAEVARQHAPAGLDLKVIELAANLGFAGGMNEALSQTSSPWILSLNADAQPSSDYLAKLLSSWERLKEWRVGAITGRLSRPSDSDDISRLDACGMRLSPTWRHFDRGSGEADRGQYDQTERVFGGTGAASLFLREALLDVAIDDEVFDIDFHTYREDAELCFRLRERGWEIIYEPSARARHCRVNLPSRRRSMSAFVNYHSFKNRYLLRAYHQTGTNFFRTLIPATTRDCLALVWVLLAERSSLKAYLWLWRNRIHILARSRLIRSRRTLPRRQIDRWFWTDSLPLTESPRSERA